MLYKALTIAYKAHDGQFRQNGEPYICHPIRVANKVVGEEAKAVALLHDVVEDTNVSLEELYGYFPKSITDAVKALTKTEGVDYQEYLAVVKKNPLARSVKMADLLDNLDITTLVNYSKKDALRIEKYIKAYDYLLS